MDSCVNNRGLGTPRLKSMNSCSPTVDFQTWKLNLEHKKVLEAYWDGNVCQHEKTLLVDQPTVQRCNLNHPYTAANMFIFLPTAGSIELQQVRRSSSFSILKIWRALRKKNSFSYFRCVVIFQSLPLSSFRRTLIEAILASLCHIAVSTVGSRRDTGGP